ncbi:hypothetical protein BDR04DRAFT_155918 [Suillus decipiens]|nr:hypothetical protein BDR04DRAFT_155918 [Suillus decipiens]
MIITTCEGHRAIVTTVAFQIYVALHPTSTDLYTYQPAFLTSTAMSRGVEKAGRRLEWRRSCIVRQHFPRGARVD